MDTTGTEFEPNMSEVTSTNDVTNGAKHILSISIWQDKGRMGGIWCFEDTRIPVSILDDYLVGTTGFGGNAEMDFEKLFTDFPQLKDKIKVEY